MVGRRGWRNDVRRVLSTGVPSWRVVTDSVFVHFGWSAVNGHGSTAVEGDTSDFGSSLPNQLSKMAYFLKYFVRQAGLTKPRYHRGKLAMVPTLCDTGSDVKGITRDCEEVLALASMLGYEVFEITSAGGDAGIGFASRVP